MVTAMAGPATREVCANDCEPARDLTRGDRSGPSAPADRPGIEEVCCG